MRLWPRSTANRVRDAFGFLAAERGYLLAAASDASMAGSLAYRSDTLCVVADWDRGEPVLFITPVGTTARFGWNVLDALLRGLAHYEGPAVPAREAPPEQLAAWLRTHLDELEARLRPPAREATIARLAEYDAERQVEVQRWWDGLRDRPGHAG